MNNIRFAIPKAWTWIGLLSLSLATVAAAPASAEIRRFRQVDTGVYRGSQPENLADYKMLKDKGIKTIINFRTWAASVAREERISRTMGFYFESFPMSAIWGVLFNIDRDTVRDALYTMADPVMQPVFIHCLEGKDRTGMMAGLYRVHVQGWSFEEAYQEALSLGFNTKFKGITRSFKQYSSHDGLFGEQETFAYPL